MNSKQIKNDLVDYLPHIRGIVHKIARYEDIVDDLSQEICVHIIEKENIRYPAKDKFKPWINSIAKNLTINYISRKKPQGQALLEDTIIPVKQDTFSKDQIKWILSQFKTLTKKQQQILRMKYYQNMRVTEIAKSLSIDHSTVSQHITSALKTLRKQARSHGLMTILLPWTYNPKFMKVAISMTYTKVTAIILFPVIFGTFFYLTISPSDDISPINMERDISKDDWNVAKKAPIDNFVNFKKEIIIPNTDKTLLEHKDISNTDLEETLKWLKKLSEKEFGDWTLEELKNAKELWLGGLPITDADLKRLKNLTSLTSLYFHATKITDKGLEHLSQMHNLQNLDLMGTKITNKGMKNLSSLTSLTNLNLSSTKITSEGLKELSSLTSLTSLKIMAMKKFTDTDLKATLSSLTSLTSIDLTKNPITDEGIKTLSPHTSLTSLGLGSTKITDEGMRELSTMTSLKSLSLAQSNITDKGLTELSQMTSLTNLDLYKTKITDKSLKQLTFLNSLGQLNLSGTNVTDEGTKELSHLTSLHSLSLSGKKISNLTLTNISSLNHLKILRLSKTKVTNEAIENAKKNMPNCIITN